MKKIIKKELQEYMRLHDRICQSCSGCRPDRKIKGKLYPKVCEFTEGYKRGQRELREKLKEVIGD